MFLQVNWQIGGAMQKSLRFVCVMIVLLPNVICADVVINEVMFHPAGSEFFDEYIELYNTGEYAVDLSGWYIGDMVITGELQDVGYGLVLLPKAFALVLDAEYRTHSNTYDPLPEHALILTLDRPAFGQNGLPNSKATTVVLISASGDTVGNMTYRVPNDAGISEEKVDALGGDGDGNWRNSKWVGGTPGRANSVSIKPVDVALTGRSDSLLVPWFQERDLTFWVKNVGQEPVSHFMVHVTGYDQASSIVGGSVGVGDSVQVDFPVVSERGGRVEVMAQVQVDGDEDPTNDRLSQIVEFGYAPNQVVMNEVMANPNLGGEWIELLNLTDQTINLQGWRLADARTEGVILAGALAPHGFCVLAEGAEGVPLSRWPALNNGGDRVVLRDRTGGVIDSITYPSAPSNVSLERIDPLKSGLEASNWLASVAGQTPGQKNSVEHTGAVSVVLKADPNPFREQTLLVYEIPTARAFVNLWIFDRAGRKVRTLIASQEGGSRREIVWDGRDDGQQFLKPGVFVVYLEARSPDGQTFQSRLPIVLTRDLSD